MTLDLSKIRSLSPGWWGAAAGAAAAGAAIVPGNRILAAAVGGGLVLAVALVATPCGCHDAAAKEAKPPVVADLGDDADPSKRETWEDWWRGAGAARQLLGGGGSGLPGQGSCG